jgi:hypothetical protein
MALKPGQKKNLDIQLKVKKIKGLQDALHKAQEYESALARYSYATPAMSKSIKDKVNALKAEIQKEYNVLKAEIATLKQKNAKVNGGNYKQVDALVKRIAKDCSQVLPYYKKTKKILLRGTQHGDMKAYEGRSWENRKAKDSSRHLQVAFDTYLKSQGFKALRSNSIFTTTALFQADEYGVLYFIYPKNGFAFHTYSEVDDLVLDDPGQVFNTDKMNMLCDDASDWYERKYNKDAPSSLYDFDDYDKPEKLIAILQKIGYPKAKNLKVESFIDGPGIRLDIGPTQKNFSLALKNGNEVCIAGEYYAIKAYSSLAKYVNNKLGLKPDNIDLDDDDDPIGDDNDDSEFGDTPKENFY